VKSEKGKVRREKGKCKEKVLYKHINRATYSHRKTEIVLMGIKAVRISGTRTTDRGNYQDG